jgi:hypothetical protein
VPPQEMIEEASGENGVTDPRRRDEQELHDTPE